jgi:regulator of protease activity HflC (stomatin/prohibitin superfamily)
MNKLINLAILIITMASGYSLQPWHSIPEGHVGIYRRFGAIQTSVTQPGLHFHMPWITEVVPMQVTLQTDSVQDIPCGTKEGITVHFKFIHVDNKLREDHVLKTVKLYGRDYDQKWIFAKIHHEINQFCSNHTLQEVYIDKFSNIDESLAAALQADCDRFDTGIDIISIRVTKPIIPTSIAINYEQLSKQKTELEIRDREFQLSQKQVARMRMEETEAAHRASEVSLIHERKITSEKEEHGRRDQLVSKLTQEMLTLEKQAEAARGAIDVAMFKEKEQARLTMLEERLRIENARLTDAYLNLRAIEAAAGLMNSTTIYYGDKLPTLSNFMTVFRDVMLPTK